MQIYDGNGWPGRKRESRPVAGGKERSRSGRSAGKEERDEGKEHSWKKNGPEDGNSPALGHEEGTEDFINVRGWNERPWKTKDP